MEETRADPRLWWLASIGSVVTLCVALGYFVELDPEHDALRPLLLLPGVLIGAALLAFGSRRELERLEDRWDLDDEPAPPNPSGTSPSGQRPSGPSPTGPSPSGPGPSGASPSGASPPAAARPAPAATQAPAPAAPRQATPAPAPLPPAATPAAQVAAQEAPLVYLNPEADPAFASWRLFWETEKGDKGVTILPGGTVTMGRHEASTIVLELTRISRHHLELQVRGNDVRVTDMGSRIGSWIRAHDGAWEQLAKGEGRPMAHGSQLKLGEPAAVIFTLDPMAGA